jgi:LemA protein
VNQLSVAVMLLMAGAVSVFWALGAYNRLMRLRSNLLKSLHDLVTQWDSTSKMLRTTLQEFTAEPANESQWGGLDNDDVPWRFLAVSAKQLQACMSAILSKPQTLPSVDDLASLRAAREVLDNAWTRLNSGSDDLAGASVPQKLTVLWQQCYASSEEKRTAYNKQATVYNAATRQFPALLIAWIFAFNRTDYL